MNVVDYLSSKGLVGKRARGPEYTYPCFFDCNEPADSRKRKLYVNSEDGFYDCKVCGARGGTTLLRRHFGDDDGDSPQIDAAARRRILTEAADLAAEMLANSEQQLRWLLDRGLSAATILDRRLGVVQNNWSLVRGIEASKAEMAQTGLVHREGPREGKDFFFDHLIIPYMNHGTVVQLRGRSKREGGPKYVTGPGEQVRLYNVDALAGAERVILTEGEFDCMILEQHLSESPEQSARSIAVVAVPGTGALPPDFETYFADARRVYIGFDADDAGRKGAEAVRELLGSKARTIELPEGMDWTDAFVRADFDWRDVMRLVDEADRANRRLSTFAESVESLQVLRHADPGLKTGFFGLDVTIEPGLHPGQVVIILAKTGTGKTVVLCNLVYNMCHIPTLLVSLEMTREEVVAMLERVFYFHHPRATRADAERAFSKLLICDENRLSEEDLERLVDEFTETIGEPPRVLMVDYLGYYARGFPGGSSYEKASNAAMQLKGEAKRHRLVVITPAQVNRTVSAGRPIDGDGARDSGVIEETADFLMSLWRPDDALSSEDDNAEPSGKLKLELLKSRHGGAGTIYTLQFDLAYLAVVDDNSREARRAQQHNYALWRGSSYEQMRAEESAPIQERLHAAAADNAEESVNE